MMIGRELEFFLRKGTKKPKLELESFDFIKITTLRSYWARSQEARGNYRSGIAV